MSSNSKKKLLYGKEYEYRTYLNTGKGDMMLIYSGCVACTDPDIPQRNDSCYFHMRPYRFEYLQTLDLLGVCHRLGRGVV